jgi:osmoprotectant transport system ATP-binding protein
MITFEAVTKRYPDGTTAVDSLDLEIPTGCITVLVGPSGCGKTTTLRMINRMIEPSSGRILLDGEDVRARPAAALRREIGYVIQHAGLFPHRTIAQNIATVPRLLGWDKRRARDRAYELMELVGLPRSYAKRYPFQLSGGQQQRVGVARALAADPPVMLMDEPFSAVDPIVRKNLQEEFLRLQGELGKTIVFVTHDVDEAIKLGDRIVLLRDGRPAQIEAPAELLANPADAFVEDFLGQDRGVRRLSFFDSRELPLHDDCCVTVGTPTQEAKTIAVLANSPWLLVVDVERKPLGWIRVGSLPSDGAVGSYGLVPYGHTFVPGEDSMRAALDAAVLSPTGCAIAVNSAGSVVGFASQDQIGSSIRKEWFADLAVTAVAAGTGDPR